ncbi:MAG: hypothetical protein WAW17_24025 [Rhodococcus sp. (in: high G+C Gram-positive bacteria)]|uniref:hypothetical protein n=1 Tax=Rhodococcus sp. TaxID=1831 RepID=UPI003BB003B1
MTTIEQAPTAQGTAAPGVVSGRRVGAATRVVGGGGRPDRRGGGRVSFRGHTADVCVGVAAVRTVVYGARTHTALPAHPVTVAAYLVAADDTYDMAGERAYVPVTLARWVAAIGYHHHATGHPIPHTHDLVLDAVRNPPRLRTVSPRAAGQGRRRGHHRSSSHTAGSSALRNLGSSHDRVMRSASWVTMLSQNGADKPLG